MTNNTSDLQVRAFLEEFQDQPEEIRQIFIYAICQTMVQTGALEFKGAFSTPGLGVTLLYRNIDSDSIFEIVKPAMTDEEEQAMRAHIAELLRDSAQAA